VPEHRLDFHCKCGTECRVVIDGPASGSAVVGFIRHCEQGRVQALRGKPLCFLERKDNQWKQVPDW